MPQPRTRPRATAATAAALVTAAVGIVVQILSGADYPAVPPGIAILLAAAAFVWFAPWRWCPAVGALAGLSQLLGLFAAGEATRLVVPDSAGDTAGLWLQLLAVTAAVLAGAAAVATNYRPIRSTAGRQ